jgi:hypothetical protein
MRTFEIKMERGQLTPAEWRTRFHHLSEMLRDPDSILVRELNEVKALAADVGNRAAEQRITQLQVVLNRAYPDLLPGEAGWRVLWAIVCEARICPWAPGDERWNRVNIFEGAIPYLHPRTNGDRPYAARKLRRDHQPLIDLLEGTPGKPPQTFRQIEATLRITGQALQYRLDQLEALGYEVRRTAKTRDEPRTAVAQQQEKYAKLFSVVLPKDWQPPDFK